jgi:hypothetical protein
MKLTGRPELAVAFTVNVPDGINITGPGFALKVMDWLAWKTKTD